MAHYCESNSGFHFAQTSITKRHISDDNVHVWYGSERIIVRDIKMVVNKLIGLKSYSEYDGQNSDIANIGQQHGSTSSGAHVIHGATGGYRQSHTDRNTMNADLNHHSRNAHIENNRENVKHGNTRRDHVDYHNYDHHHYPDSKSGVHDYTDVRGDRHNHDDHVRAGGNYHDQSEHRHAEQNRHDHNNHGRAWGIDMIMLTMTVQVDTIMIMLIIVVLLVTVRIAMIILTIGMPCETGMITLTGAVLWKADIMRPIVTMQM